MKAACNEDPQEAQYDPGSLCKVHQDRRKGNA
jgi:hypothetical protein